MERKELNWQPRLGKPVPDIITGVVTSPTCAHAGALYVLRDLAG